MSLVAGTLLGPYEITAQIGAGGMGEVYGATDTRLGRTVAIKVLPEHLAADPQRRERFEREARAVSSLNHPHICTLFDVGEENGTHFLVMELVEGETLERRLQNGRLPVEQALTYAIQIADALDKAHRRGVIHRDLKPGNIMLTTAGVKLLDFGLAKLNSEESAVSSMSQMPTQSAAPLTAEGTILGTMQYMAPEQLAGKEADARADIFAFGAVVYEMVTGKRAFDGGSQASVIHSIMGVDPQQMAEIQLKTPPLLDHVVARCLDKDADNRWQTASDVMRELEWIAKTKSQVDSAASLDAASISPDGPGSRSGKSLAMGIVVSAIVLAMIVWALDRSPENATGLTTTPVVILMDTTAPAGVYDTETLHRSGTNADDLNDVLSDLPILLHKETIGSTWNREDQILRQNPDLILIHRSGFFHSMNFELGFGYPPFESPEGNPVDPEKSDEQRYERLSSYAKDKLVAFLGYIGHGSPDARFLIYSRGHGGRWSDPDHRQSWVAEAEHRFPALEGRIFTMDVLVEGDRATFLKPSNTAAVRAHVQSILDLGSAEAQQVPKGAQQVPSTS